MKIRLVICGLWAVGIVILAHFTDAHVLLAGGAPCLIIINEGGRAYGAAESFEASRPDLAMPLALLKAAVSASCALTSYGSLYKQGEGQELEGDVLTKIGDFHKDLIAHIQSPSYDIVAHSEKLERLNRKLCNLIEPGTYPDSPTLPGS